MCIHAGSDLTVGDQTIAGLGAGVAAAFVACPTELIKCRLQAQGSDNKTAVATAEAGTTGAAAEAAKNAPKVSVVVLSICGGCLHLTLSCCLRWHCQIVMGVEQILCHEHGCNAMTVPGTGCTTPHLCVSSCCWYTAAHLNTKFPTRQHGMQAIRYKGPMDVASHVWRNEGGVKGLYKGMGATMLREVPGNAFMFGAYEYIKISLAKQQVNSSFVL